MRFRAIYLLPALILFQCSSSSFERFPAQTKMVLDASGYLYDPSDRSCDGFPRLQVETLPGTCLGLVMPLSRASAGDPKKNFIMPRTIQQIPGTKEFLVVDMGGWKPNNGKVYWMKPDAKGQYQLTAVRAGLNTPHGFRLGADGFFYVGETQAISRFKFVNGQVSGWQLVVSNLPRFKGHMHPLTQFTFDPRNGDMYINSGAPSDHCYQKDGKEYESCPETESGGMGAIYRVPGAWLKNLPAGGITRFEHTASGLRNSMAMVVHSSGYLIQGENSRDFPEQEEPYEELNVIPPSEINKGFHYGWPYCYNAHAQSPEWKFKENYNAALRTVFTSPVNCQERAPKNPGEYQSPQALMPPHVAPLHMAYYTNGSLPLKDKLLVSWHGYQPSGQRLVAYDIDEQGRPWVSAADSADTYLANPKAGCAQSKPFRPKGGVDVIAAYTEVISGWGEIKGVRPKGAPVGFTVAEDGSIFLVEDRANRTVVRLAKGEAFAPARCGDTRDSRPDPRIELLAWRHFLRNNPSALKGYEGVRGNLVKKYCASCHGGFQEKDIAIDRFAELDYLVKNEWVKPSRPDESKLYQAIAQTGDFPPMPPGGSPQFLGTPEGENLLKATSDWIKSLPDLSSTFKRTNMAGGRKVRNQPSTGGKACGEYGEGEVVYIDPRESTWVKADGWVWAKTYVVPGDSRLFQGQCEYPEDGVFFVAVRKQ